MDLIQVDEIHLEAAQRRVARLENIFAAEASAIESRRHRAVHLGRDDDLVALGHLAEPSPGDLLTRADRIDVGRVVEIDPRLDRGREMIARLVHRENPVAPFLVAVTHASEADARDGDSGLAQFRVLHNFSDLFLVFVLGCLASQNSGARARMSRPKQGRRGTKTFVKFSGYSKNQFEFFKSGTQSRPLRGILLAPYV